MAVAVYQSGQAVQFSGWYEAVGHTRTRTTSASEQPVVIRLKAGAAFPDWKGRAVCWRALAYSLVESPHNVSSHAN